MVQANLKQTYQSIVDYASNPLGDMRVVDEFPFDSHARQGDVYVARLESFDPTNAVVMPERQLAPGTSTGSRHTVSDAVQVYKTDQHLKCVLLARGYGVIGPVVVAKDRWTLMHPEHADISMPAGIFQISYQVDPNTLSRVLD